MMPKIHGEPVLKTDDKYFGNYWAQCDRGDRVDKLLLIQGRPNPKFIYREPENVASTMRSYVTEIAKVEAKLEELTGIPTFSFDIPPDDDSDAERGEGVYIGVYDDTEDRFWRAAREHRCEWIWDAIKPSNVTSPFHKLSDELLGLILDFALRDFDKDWEFEEDVPNLMQVCKVRSADWEDWCCQDADERVGNLVELTRFLFAKWKELREALVSKYEANEETRKEWEKLREAGELPY